MAKTCPVIIVSGFLGAGKTRLIETISASNQVSQQPDAVNQISEAIFIEASGLQHPDFEASKFDDGDDVRIVTVVDAANLIACLADEEMSDLIEQQILAADCVVLARADVVNPAEARAKVAAITQVPIIDYGITPTMLVAILGAGKAPISDVSSACPDLSGSYATWSYSGPGILTAEAIDNFLVERPRGAFRIFGTVKCPSQGVAVDVIGRVRQTLNVEVPNETTITAIGPSSTFSVRAMNLAFTEAIMDASYSMGRIACR